MAASFTICGGALCACFSAKQHTLSFKRQKKPSVIILIELLLSFANGINAGNITLLREYGIIKYSVNNNGCHFVFEVPHSGTRIEICNHSDSESDLYRQIDFDRKDDNEYYDNQSKFCYPSSKCWSPRFDRKIVNSVRNMIGYLSGYHNRI